MSRTQPSAARIHFDVRPSVVFPLGAARPDGACLLLNPRLAAELAEALAEAESRPRAPR